MPPRILILRAPGTNCDLETAFAFQQAGGTAERVHINRLLGSPKLADDYQVLCIPGGFSYGDDLAAGRILASQVRHHLADCIRAFCDAGKLVLGICNGFQVLTQTGILLANDELGPPATLTDNDSGRFVDRWVRLDVVGNKCILLAGIESLELPVAHAEGKFVARDQETIDRLAAAGQLVLRYHAEDNPNGSMANVAGVCDSTGRVLGLMPHPERFIDPTQHPRWTRERIGPVGAGLKIFRNAVEYFR